MNLTSKVANVAVAFGMMCIIGCATNDLPIDIKSRSVVEDMDDDEISVNGTVSMAAMKKERKMQIAVAVEIIDETQGRARLSPSDKQMLVTDAEKVARNYLQKVKAYKLDSVEMADLNRTLKSNDDINGIAFPFLIKMKAILTSETTPTRYDDWVTYNCVLQWDLVDNRTTSNGLGANQNPTVVESMTCQNGTKRRMRASVSGKAGGLGGFDYKNAISAYTEVINNCMFLFHAQLANRIPFGGVVSGLKILDGDMYFTIKADQEYGIKKKMQMLLTTDEGDRIAVGEVLSMGNGRSNVKIWRWLSKSYRKQMKSVVEKGKDEVENWLDENTLYALCLGLPELDKDELKDYRRQKPKSDFERAFGL